MKLRELVARPELIEITLDDPETRQTYGEPITFWTWNRQPLHVFMALSRDVTDHPERVIDQLRTMILDENGQPILGPDDLLPTGIQVRVFSEIMTALGK